MIYGIFHEGSGLGNQLHRYVATRLQGDFGMVAPELFKGSSFMNLEMGKSMSDYHVEYPAGKVIPHTNESVLDGEFQSEDVWNDRIDEVREWLKVEQIEMPDDVCVINFRGGEYVGVRHLFLPKEYWAKGIEIMRAINPLIKFEVHTDDGEIAHIFFPDFPIISDIGINWRSIRYAKYLLLSNSSFAILPAYLNENVRQVITPQYWAGYINKEWVNPDNNYRKFNYIHHENSNI